MDKKEKNIIKKEKNLTGLISEKEKSLALRCMEAALRHGADQARVSLNKSVLDSYSMLNGELDKVAHSADRSIFLYVFADGKYGTFSTNMLDETELDRFAAQAVESVKMLAEDRYRTLPELSRTACDAVTGRELGLYDESYEDLTSEDRLRLAGNECIFKDIAAGTPLPDEDSSCDAGAQGSRRFLVISEECEYSDSVDDNFTADSHGFSGRHTETSFAICSEITIEAGGKKYSGYWWDSSPYLSGLHKGICSETALNKAVSQIGPERHRGGKFRMVVDRSVSSRLISPVISALNAASIQQESSFLKDSLGKKLFSDGLTLVDLARTPGKPGSRFFDTEGVATNDMAIIRNGTVETWFVNTYMAGKMGIKPTIEGVSRPVLMPYHASGHGIPDSFGADEMIAEYGSGIYVTGFNGGNCNPTTGNFSYGIEGFAFKNGKVTHPVREMIITGNMLELWNGLLAAGNDARAYTRWQIPSLCFGDVHFSA